MKTTLALMIALGPFAWGSATAAEPPGAELGTLCEAGARSALVGNQVKSDSLSAGSLISEITAVVDSFRTVEERLQTEFYVAANDSAAQAVMADLASLDLARKRCIMEIQMRHARRQGRTDLAHRIDTSMMALAKAPNDSQLPAE